MSWFDRISLVGMLIGFWVSIHQIQKTKRAAEAAREAAEAARKGLRANLILTDLGRCSAIIDELKVLVHGGRYDAAYLRSDDLAKNLIQLREVFRQQGKTHDFQPIITGVGSVRAQVGRKVHGDQRPLDPQKILRTLSAWSDELAGLVGEATHAEPEEKA